MRALARWGALPMLATPFGAWALGLGDIELRSALNQPFNADISLVSATAEELAGLRVSLASPDTFARYGLDRPAFLSGLEFSVTRDAQGRDVIRVTSRQSMTEPFVTLLIEASWARGRLLREYTVLLDPPVLLPSQAAPAQVQPAETFAPQAGAGDIARPAQPPAAAAPQPAPAPVQPPAAQPAPAAAPARAADGTWTVQRAETLWSIASQLQPQGVTLNQTMVALYEANPQAFDGNMNMLRAGAVLRIPDAQTLAGRSAAAASQEFQRQLADWQTGADQDRLRLVAPAEETAGQAAVAAPAGAAADPAAGASAAEVSRLQQELTAAQAELEESRRLLEMRNEELAALQARLGAVDEAAPSEPVAADAAPAPAPGVDLESEPLFADELPADEAAAAEEAATAAAAAEAAEAVAPAPTPAPVVTPTAPQPSLLDRVLGWLAAPFLWIGLGVVALVGALVWFLRARRPEEADDLTGRWDQLQAESDDDESESIGATARMRRDSSEDSIVVEEQRTPRGGRREPSMGAAAGAAAAGALAGAAAGRDRGGDDSDDAAASSPTAAADASADLQAPAAEDTLSSQTLVNLDQADVMAEADFHMAYGLYDQAAELITKGLEQEPGRRDLKLKLLEVYFVWGNRDAFLDAARSLHAEVGDGRDGDWDKVVIMGKQICPDEPMFASATASAGEVDMALDAGDSDALDFAFDSQDDTDGQAGSGMDLDFGEVTGSDIEFKLDDETAASTGIDFDFGDQSADDADSDDRESIQARAAADFDSLDIGERTAAGIEAAILSDDEDEGAGTHTDIDPLAATQESPTVESRQRPEFGFGDDDATEETPRFDAPTMETPTLEVPGPDSPTMESPTLESRLQSGGDAGDGDDADEGDATAWLNTLGEGTSELPTIEQPGLNAGADDQADYTAEINLDDLGLDVSDLKGLSDELGDLPGIGGEGDTREQPKLSEDNDGRDGDDRLLSATGITQVLGDDDDFEQQQTSILSPEEVQGIGDPDAISSLTRTEVLEVPEDGDRSGSTSMVRALNIDDVNAGSGNDLDLDLDDLSSALDGGETVEQPRAPEFSSELFADDSHTPVDLDIGSDSVLADDEPTGTEEAELGTETLTEVGTKLDLARAYIDMGDPDGARSILEEVLEEGDTGQRREAQGLIDTLGT